MSIVRSIIGFLNDNGGFVTFVVGFSAIYLYIRQRVDRKRDAASLILQEIRFAEQYIRNYKSQKSYNMSDKVLPTNSWNDNIHLFIKDLEQNEADLISRFYSKAAYLDILIGKISDFKNMPLQSVPSGTAVPQMSPVGTPGTVMIPMPLPIELMPTTQGIMQEVSQSMEFVYNTPAGEKLKRISRRRWYWLF